MSDMEKDTKSSLEENPLLKEIFVSVAHQWRGPLSQINSIVGSIDNRLYELGIDDPLLTKKLSEIEAVTKEMSQSIDDYRGYFKKNKESFFLRDLVLSAVKSVKTSMQMNDIVIENVVDASVKCNKERDLLKQVVIVLLDNARDALVARNIYRPKIKIEAKEDESFLSVVVCDNAGGMSKSIREKIFEPDFTTKHSSEGTGFGLFMAKRLLDEKMQATLSVKNMESGTCFTIEIPKDKNE